MQNKPVLSQLLPPGCRWLKSPLNCFAKREACTITVYTDSQNIISLPRRRKRLESGNYVTRQNNKISNAGLYQQFYQLTDMLSCTLVKMKGHQSGFRKDKLDQFFTLVDRAARQILKEDV